MRLTQTAEYALRAAAQMAVRPEGTPVRARDLSEETGIPVHYLSKILRHLVTHGILTSRKGHGGGFEFAMPPARIRFLDILRAVNFSFDADACFFGWGVCDPDRPCPLHHHWGGLREVFHQWAEQSTLADIGRGAFREKD